MKSGTKVRAAAASIALLAGCAGQQTHLAREDLASLSSQREIHAVHHRPIGPVIQSSGYTAATMLVGPFISAGAAFAEASELQSKLGLEDPLVQVKHRLAAALQTELKLANVRMVEEPILAEDVELLKEKFRSGVVLDVATAQWGIDNNRVKYMGRARLVRLADRQVIWDGTCKIVIGEDKPSPTREALVANDGALLKANLREAGDACADQLARWMTGKAR